MKIPMFQDLKKDISGSILQTHRKHSVRQLIINCHVLNHYMLRLTYWLKIWFIYMWY